jgi:hypothetical protein
MLALVTDPPSLITTLRAMHWSHAGGKVLIEETIYLD